MPRCRVMIRKCCDSTCPVVRIGGAGGISIGMAIAHGFLGAAADKRSGHENLYLGADFCPSGESIENRIVVHLSRAVRGQKKKKKKKMKMKMKMKMKETKKMLYTTCMRYAIHDTRV